MEQPGSIGECSRNGSGHRYHSRGLLVLLEFVSNAGIRAGS